MEKDKLKSKLMEYGKELGFSDIKITSAEPLLLWEKGIARRKELDPGATKRWEGMTADPQEILPNAKVIVVGTWPYTPYSNEFPEGVGTYSAYYREYPKGREAAQRLAEILEDKGYVTVVNPPLPAKVIALRAGIGYYGKNGLIHTRDRGSWISIHYILTDAPLPIDPSVDYISDCGECRACIDACPTSAITDKGTVLPSKCIRYHMLSSDFVPVDIREKMGTRLLGCEECQISCPRNKNELGKSISPPLEEMEIFDIEAILSEWRNGLKRRMGRMGEIIGRNYSRAQKVLSMAVILAGNTKNPSYIPLLVDTLKHTHPPIRGHSAWALGKIGGEQAGEILRYALEKETDDKVIKELQNALTGYNRGKE